MMLKNEKRPGYKKTKVGWIPKDWDCVPLGQVFKKRTARGKQGVPVFSVTQDRGMVLRATLERKSGNDVSADKSLLVEPGDVAYNMMRMWQGAVAVSKERCVISPAYVVCRPNAGQVDANFMLAYFKSKEGMHKLCAYSYGITSDRLRLYYEDFSLVPAPLPSILEQKAIAEVLACWDKALLAMALKISNKRQVKNGLSQRLLIGEQRLPNFSGKWKKTRLNKVASLRTEKLVPQQITHQLFCVELEHIESATGRLLGNTITNFTSSLKTIFHKNDVLFGKLRPNLRKSWLADQSGVCSTEIWVLVPDRQQVTSQYLFQITRTDSFVKSASQTFGTHMPRSDWSALSHHELKIPPLDEQRAIAKVLSAADAEIEALEQKLVLFKSQKKHLLNNLVTGTIRLPQFCNHGKHRKARK